MTVRQMNPFTQPRTPPREEAPPAPRSVEMKETNGAAPPLERLFGNFNIKNFHKDDWILLAIIGALILEGSSDYILLCALGYLFIMGL